MSPDDPIPYALAGAAEPIPYEVVDPLPALAVDDDEEEHCYGSCYRGDDECVHCLCCCGCTSCTYAEALRGDHEVEP